MGRSSRGRRVAARLRAGGMILGALSGFTIAVTADRRAEEQAQLIARRGGEVQFGPVIRTKPLGDEARLAEVTASLVARPPDVVVLSTAVGVRGWISGAEGLGVADDLLAALDGAQVLARGAKAAGAALTAGLHVDWTTPSATYTEVVDHLGVGSSRRADGTPLRIALQLDGEHRPEITASLEDAGFEVVEVPVYESHVPEDRAPAERVVAAVAEGSVDAVTFTSGLAVTRFAEIADDLGLRDEVLGSVNSGAVVAVCVGPVTAERARSVGFETLVQPNNARLGAMVQALVVAFSGRVNELDLDGRKLLLQGRLVSVDGGEPIRLTDREHAVLGILARRPGAVVSKKALLEEVWEGESDDHVVEVTVARLRHRLGAAGASIETVVRRGYRLAVN